MDVPAGAQKLRGRIWSVGSELKAVSGTDTARIVTGFASRPTVDRVNEVVDTTAFEKSLAIFRQNPVMLYMHDPRRPIGKFTQLDRTPEGLAVTGEVAQGTQDAEDAWKLVQQGVLKAFSIGFRELGEGLMDEQNVHHITDLELYEVSIVSIPANREALFTVAEGKLLDVEMLDHRKAPTRGSKGVIPYHKYPVQEEGAAWDAGAARRSLASYAKSGDGYDFSKYRLGFTYVEEGAETNLTGYKLPHHVVTDGELKTNLRGCRAVIGVLAGARGGAGIPDTARQGVYNHVARHIKADFGADTPAYGDLAAAIAANEDAGLGLLGITAAEVDAYLAETAAGPAAAAGDTAPDAAAPEERVSDLDDLNERVAHCEEVAAQFEGLQKRIDALLDRTTDLETLLMRFIKRMAQQTLDKATQAGIDLSALTDEQAGDRGEPGPTAAPTA